MREPSDFGNWAEEFAAEWVRFNPQLATMRQYFSGAEQDALDRQLTLANPFGTPYGIRATRAQAALARRGLDGLAEFSAERLAPVHRASAALLKSKLEGAVADAEFADHRFVFSQMVGLQASIFAFLLTLHPLRNARDAENYLARLALVAPCLDEGIEDARSAAAAGVIPPRFVLERTIEQVDSLMPADEADHPLVRTFAQRLAALDDVSEERAREFLVAAAREVRESVMPALGRVRALLEAQLPRASDAAGAWALPRGAEFYARELAAATGSSHSAREIHEIGLREVARLEREMDAILRQLGFADGSVKERTEMVNAVVGLPAGDDPRAAILDALESIVADAERRSRAVFNLRPKAPVVVRREPAFSERSAAAHYTPPAPDGTHPGVYWIPLADLDPNVPWLGVSLKATAYHEAIPGHHFQLALELETDELPYFRKRGAMGYEPSYHEGWALYAEQLCAENDWYGDDLHGRLGYLLLQIFRARRLVVDTGLHELRWTREQAIAYGFTQSEAERYASWPGQACAYMMGQLRIMALRERAKRELGAAFSIKGFHDLILSGGALPLDVLDAEVAAWSRSA